MPGNSKNVTSGLNSQRFGWWSLMNPGFNLYTDSWAALKGRTRWPGQWEDKGWLIMNKPLWGQERRLSCLQEPEVVLTIFHVLAHKALTLPDNQETDAQAPVWTFATHLSVEIPDWEHGKSSHHSTQVAWHTAKNARMPLKYSDLTNLVTSCPVCFKQLPRTLPKTPGALRRHF